MNQNTVLSIVVIGGLAAVGYLIYKNTKAKETPPVVQVTSPGNAEPANPTAAIINAGSDALGRVAEIFGV